MYSKRFHYDAALKRKVIIFAAERGNRAAGRKFAINEANVRRWRNGRASLRQPPRASQGQTKEDTLMQMLQSSSSSKRPVGRYINKDVVRRCNRPTDVQTLGGF
jgi:hypothetical protein